LASSRDALVAAHSRSNETEADDIGCKLAAMSCYDTRRGAEVFRTMQEADEANGRAKHDLMSSHPPSQERYETLRELTETENYEQFSYCNTLAKRITRAMASKK
jgi:predicted Zn-dependent protease